MLIGKFQAFRIRCIMLILRKLKNPHYTNFSINFLIALISLFLIILKIS
jgi:hypothetical protein